MKYSLRNFALTFIISLIIFGAIAWGIVGALKNMSEDILTSTAVKTEDNPNNGLITGENNQNNQDEIDFKGKTFNFLAIGLDKMPLTDSEIEKLKSQKENENKEFFSSMEAIMLVRADKENRKFVFVSLPTDFIINYKGENLPLGQLTKKLNIRDPEQLQLLLNEVTSLTGLTINYYAFIDMEGFVDAIDNLGGIEYTVPQNMKYEDPEQNLVIEFRKNQKLTSGKDMLKMLRYVTYNSDTESKNEEFDFTKARSETHRTALHMNFVNELFNKMLTVENLVFAPNWIPDLFKSTITNFTFEAVSQNVDLIFSYKDYSAVNLVYSQGYNNYIGDKYSDSEPNKELIKAAIARISTEIGKMV